MVHGTLIDYFYIYEIVSYAFSRFHHDARQDLERPIVITVQNNLQKGGPDYESTRRFPPFSKGKFPVE